MSKSSRCHGFSFAHYPFNIDDPKKYSSCVTDYDEAWSLRPLYQERVMSYYCCSLQKGTEAGGLHCQGYIQFKSGQTVACASKYISNGLQKKCGASKQISSAECNRQYCLWGYEPKLHGTPEAISSNVRKPDGTIYWEEYGVIDLKVPGLIDKRQGQGARNDIPILRLELDRIRQEIERDRLTLDQCIVKYPDIVSRHRAVVLSFITMSCNNRPMRCGFDFTRCTIMSRMMAYLIDPSSHRNLIWLWSVAPGQCKTQRLHYLFNHCKALGMGCQMIPVMPDKDMAMTWDESNIVFIDCPRAVQKEDFPFKFVEQLMDDCVGCSKYESRMKRCRNPEQPVKLFIAANFSPQSPHMSSDRPIELNIEPRRPDDKSNTNPFLLSLSRPPAPPPLSSGTGADSLVGRRRAAAADFVSAPSRGGVEGGDSKEPLEKK